MAAPPSASGTPITDRRDLVEYLAAGGKPADRRRIGTEHEKFAFRRSDKRPLPFDGPGGVEELLRGFRAKGWLPVEEGGRLIALHRGAASITLEPGGQVELSGAPLASIHATRAELDEHLREVREIGDELGIDMMGLGFQPKWTRDETPWMPKGRYAIMRRHMPRRGSLGIDMMLRTCTVQVNLDFADEADMVEKFRVSLALQPIATALFANSPFTGGKPNGYQSWRAHIWTDTDPDRTGDLPFVFESGFGFERYVEYLLDVPMYFVYRDGGYIDTAGRSFRDFLDGRLEELPGETPLLTDWADHSTTAFPDVRLKRYLEMRGADAGSRDFLIALPALWTGLLYDGTALDAAWDLVKDWTREELAELRSIVPRLGIHAPFRRGRALDAAARVVEIASAGLAARGILDAAGRDETPYLDPLRRVIESGRSAADELLERFNGSWAGAVDPVFTEAAY